MKILIFVLGVMVGMLLACYLIGSAVDKKFDTKEEFEKWWSRIK